MRSGPLSPEEKEILGTWPQPQDLRLRLLLRRWAEWREGNLVPKRSRVDPAAIKPCLPMIWMWRLNEARDGVVCTLAGEEVNRAWGFSIIGRDPVSLWGPEAGGIVLDRLIRAALIPALFHGRTGIVPAAASGLTAERLILPLRNDDGSPFGIFGITMYRYDQSSDDKKRPIPMLVSHRHPCASLPAELPPEA